jgi:hypothetical protein
MPLTHRRALVGSAGAVFIFGLGLLLAVTAPAAPSSLTLTATDAVIGETIGATAELSESPGASGEILFEAFAADDSTCSGEPLFESSTPVSGEGQYPSEDFIPPVAGTYRWSAHYSGDGENLAADSICSATSTVAKATPGLTGSASDGVVGTAIDDEATLSGGFEPTGEVSFSVYGPADTDCSTPLQTTAAPLESGSASSADFVPQQAGGFRWTAAYPGDANNEPAATACGAANQTSAVAKAEPSLSGEATAAVTAGQTITDEVSLTGGFAPDGELVFRAYGPANATCAGSPAYEASVDVSDNGSYSPSGFAPGAGSYRWTVSYSGDANNEPASLACNAADQSSAVAKATPGLTGSASTGFVGSGIHDKATVTGGFSPTGDITFRVYGPADTTCSTPLQTSTSPLASSAATSAEFIPEQVGAFRWTASYPGDANNEPASLACNAANQASAVAKSKPALAGAATSAPEVGQTITDEVSFTGGFAAAGELVFRAYGPGNTTCASPFVYEETVEVDGNGSYSPPGFAPAAGLYRWTVSYSGDANNEPASLACNAANQASAVATVAVTLTAGATGNTVGEPITSTATIKDGAVPAGQVTFKAFPPSDANCSGAAAFSSVINVGGEGSYRSAAFAPSQVGTFRWTVSYSGDTNHFPAEVGCGKTTSAVTQAKPSITGAVPPQANVGAAFQDAATLQGGYTPGGTITFRIYDPGSEGCAKPAFVNIVTVTGNGTFNSDPFVALRPGRYTFVASYSGDAENQGATEPCESPGQAVEVLKRKPKVKPRALLTKGKQIAIRARLSAASSPTGAITFRLYGPGDKRCKRKPKFGGGVTVKSNGTFPLARYLATRSGVYRLTVGYSGDQRNQRYKASCTSAQPIRVG